jgi:hypothetical protein
LKKKYEDRCVVRAIGINAILDGQRREVSGQIVQIYLGLLLLGFLVVHVLDVYAPVCNKFL